MQTMVSGGALRLPFRFSGAKPKSQNNFAFLQRRFTPRTVFMEIVSGQFLHSVPVPCNLRLVLCDGVRIPVPEASVDLAWGGRFLAQLHPDDRLEHLRSVRRSLAPGGVYFCAAQAFVPQARLRYAAR